MASESHDFILHVIVVGFHHKKGGLVEYAYPPLLEGRSVDSQELPHEWRHLPSLALPDGAHNFTNDTVYFHLPSRDDSNTVYGVSCYRQVDVRNLINRTADMTRSTVQKSVCVLSRLPLFGLIKAKLELITHAYFEERDFSQVDLLQKTYNNLCGSISESCLTDSSQIFHGLSVRDVVAMYKHKIVLMFKLFLLERRVLFFGAPVEKLTSTLLTMISLFPGLLEYGLEEATCPMKNRLSPTVQPLVDFPGSQSQVEDFMEVRFHRDISLGEDGAMEELSLTIPQEPESPSIPRDDPDLKNWRKPKFKKNSENLMLQLSQGTDSMEATGGSSPQISLDVLKGQDEIAAVHVAASRSLNLESASVNGRPVLDSKEGLATETLDRDPDEVEESGDVLIPKTDSPLADLPSIVHIEAVQGGASADAAAETAAESVDAMVGEQLEGSPVAGLPGETRLSWDQSDSIEELDSPESINKIDMEDCFSWEEDAVHLAINHDTDPSISDEESKKPASDTASAAKEAAVSQASEGDAAKPGSGAVVSHTPRKKHNFKTKLSAAFGNLHLKQKAALAEAATPSSRSRSNSATGLRQDDYGFPLAIFTKGGICHPYLSLQYHDLLQDPNVSSFIIGATNVLFHQHRNRLDAIVEVEEGKLEIRDRELQKQVALSTADLRFADYLVKTVLEDKDNTFLDGTEWEGGDEWLRAQFRMYLQCLLVTMKQTDDPKLQEDFGLHFVSAFRQTHSYRHWSALPHPAMADIVPGHPYQGHMNMADVRVRLAQAMQSSERGRRLNAAMVSTGKYVVQTGKVVGGALTQARSAVSSWFSSWRTGDKHAGALSPSSSSSSVPGSQENLVEKQSTEPLEKSSKT